MKQKTLSIFIDESGDFGLYDTHCPYYLVTMLFHEQDRSISSRVTALEAALAVQGFENHAIHTGPLIRREFDYKLWSLEKRRHLFRTLFNFIRQVDINYATVLVPKFKDNDRLVFRERLSRKIGELLRNNAAYVASFKRVIVYYDNGQKELTKILLSSFNALFTHIEFRQIEPKNYLLFQATDLICTLELVAQKIAANNQSLSEKLFFGPPRDFKKSFFKQISLKRL